MKCKHARQALVLDYYGELSPAEKTELESHLRSCGACMAEREDILRVFALLEANPPAPVPDPDTERVWSGVESQLAPAKSPARRRHAWAAPQWSLAGAALVLVLVAGIFIGRSVFAPQVPVDLTAAASKTPNPAAALKPALAGHLEDLKPLLLEYANYSPETASGHTVAIDENLLQALMLQNILLRKALAKSDPAAADLLDDCDLILKEIINRNRPTAASPDAIRGLIRDRDVLFKLEIMKKI
ncbi:MAG: anti-sigma factor family protein [Candidatus Aminicenantales bacterium]